MDGETALTAGKPEPRRAAVPVVARVTNRWGVPAAIRRASDGAAAVRAMTPLSRGEERDARDVAVFEARQTLTS